MPPVTLSAISNTATKVRWKEPYASEGLNRKVAVVIPSGVYRGLNLGVSASNLSVDLLPDSVAGDHVAVQESSTGFSITYIDDTSGIITLPLTAFLANDVVVICLVVNYTSGSSTTAEFRGYELSEFEALSSAVRDSLVVLGTVLRPAAGIIPASNITHDRRKLPFLHRTSESTPWNPLLKNGGFELGHTNATYANASPFWTTSSSNANFTIRPVTTESNSGSKSLEITNSLAGTVTATIWQDLYTPVTPGRYMMGRLYKKSIQAATTSPVGRIRFVFGDADGINDVQEDILFEIDAVNGAFVEVSGIIKVPTTARVLKGVYVIVAGTYAGTGPAIRIDDVQAWMQVDPANWNDAQDSRAGEGAFSRLFLGPTNSFSTAGAKLSYSGTILEMERSDSNLLVRPPAISIPARSSVSLKYTLVFQSLPPGNPGYRKYVSRLGNLLEVVNASYDAGTDTWTKDVPGTNALRNETSASGILVYERVADADWLDSAWDAQFTVGTAATFTQSPMFQQDIRHGDRTLVIPCFNFQWETTGFGATDILLDQGFIVTMKFVVLNLGIPLITGDRIKSVTLNLLGNGVADVSSAGFYIRSASGISTTIFTGNVTNPPAVYADYTFNIPDYTLQVGESFCAQFVCNAAGLQIANTSVVYDHPFDT